MTHTLHRQGTVENLADDYPMLTIRARGHNDGGLWRMQKILEMASRYPIVNFGDIKNGSKFTTTLDQILGSSDQNLPILHMVFTSKDDATRFHAGLERGRSGHFRCGFGTLRRDFSVLQEGRHHPSHGELLPRCTRPHRQAAAKRGSRDHHHVRALARNRRAGGEAHGRCEKGQGQPRESGGKARQELSLRHFQPSARSAAVTVSSRERIRRSKPRRTARRSQFSMNTFCSPRTLTLRLGLSLTSKSKFHIVRVRKTEFLSPIYTIRPKELYYGQK